MSHAHFLPLQLQVTKETYQCSNNKTIIIRMITMIFARQYTSYGWKTLNWGLSWRGRGVIIRIYRAHTCKWTRRCFRWSGKGRRTAIICSNRRQRSRKLGRLRYRHKQWSGFKRNKLGTLRRCWIKPSMLRSNTKTLSKSSLRMIAAETMYCLS